MIILMADILCFEPDGIFFFIAAESHWFIFPFPKSTIAISARCSMPNEAKIRHQIKDSSDHRGPCVALGFLNI